VTVETAQVPAFRTFLVEVSRVQRLSPSFVRVCFAGPDLDEFASGGADQRIKVVLPLPGRGVRDFPLGPDWYGQWRLLPESRRNPLRSYTVRAARPLEREVDVDFVLHGPSGPASSWAADARPGDRLALVGPNARFAGEPGGVEWRPPAGASELVLGGDETAVPAICAIIEALPHDTRARALMEVPTAADVLDLAVPAGVEVTWLGRGSASRGEPLRSALLDVLRPAGPGTEVEDVDEDLLWEVPTGGGGDGPYVWLAGEASVVTGLRRLLVRDLGIDRRRVAFMGYWREGLAQH
jgi:NADPH-dependent ferric siderophore reductase